MFVWFNVNISDVEMDTEEVFGDERAWYSPTNDERMISSTIGIGTKIVLTLYYDGSGSGDR